jgi:hypothetical protein
LRHGPAGEFAEDHDKERIKDRDQQDQDRNGEYRKEAPRPSPHWIRAQQCRTGQKEPDEHRAAVTHEDRGRVRVVHQESHERGGEDGEQESVGRLPIAHEAGREEGGGDRGDARRQPVHVVEQVDRIGDADQPDERDRHVEHGCLRPGQREPEGNHDRRSHDLADQLLVRLEADQIVQQPDQEQERACAQDHEERGRKRHQGQVDQGHRDEDRHAPHQGCGLLVPAIALGSRHQTSLPCLGTHQGGDEQNPDKGEQYRQKVKRL